MCYSVYNLSAYGCIESEFEFEIYLHKMTMLNISMSRDVFLNDILHMLFLAGIHVSKRFRLTLPLRYESALNVVRFVRFQ